MQTTLMQGMMTIDTRSGLSKGLRKPFLKMRRNTAVPYTGDANVGPQLGEGGALPTRKDR